MRSADEMCPEDLPPHTRRVSPFSDDWENVWEPRAVARQGSHYQAGGRAPERPDTPMQALMEAAPFEDPEVSKLENLPLKDAIADAIDSLDDRSRFIFEKVHYEGYAVRELEGLMSLSKTQVHRIYTRAVKQVRDHLSERFGIAP